MKLLWNAYTEEEFNLMKRKVNAVSLKSIELTKDTLGIVPKSYLLYNETYNKIGSSVFIGEEIPFVVVEYMLGRSTLYELKGILEKKIGSEVVCMDAMQFYKVYGGEYILTLEAYVENPSMVFICTFWLQKNLNSFVFRKAKLKGKSKNDESYDLDKELEGLTSGICGIARELNSILEGRRYDVKNVTVRLSANSYEKGVGTLWKYSWQLEEWGDCRRYYYGENVEVVKGSNSPIVRSLILI